MNRIPVKINEFPFATINYSSLEMQFLNYERKGDLRKLVISINFIML